MWSNNSSHGSFDEHERDGAQKFQVKQRIKLHGLGWYCFEEEIKEMKLFFIHFKYSSPNSRKKKLQRVYDLLLFMFNYTKIYSPNKFSFDFNTLYIYIYIYIYNRKFQK